MGRHYRQLSCEDRAMIHWGLGQGWSQRALARCVSRSPSTISRELHRNGWRDPTDPSPPIGRPRKTLDWRCPVELFSPDDFDYQKHFESIVALRP